MNGAAKAGAESTVVLAVDAMGGDAGPAPVIAGAARAAAKDERLRFLFFGDRPAIEALAGRRSVLSERFEVRHAPDVVTMDARPSHAMRHGKSTSMWLSLDAVRDGDAAACVSCGNTGALMAMAMVRLRKLEGINRPAIACLWPARNPSGFNIMLDAGADIRADAEDLLQYAMMGAAYARVALERPTPRVGLLNVGTEEHKGRPELRDAFDLIEAAASEGGFAFVGYVEGGDLPSDAVDVVVTDGFTGNIALKTGEGTARLIRELLAQAFRHSILSRFAALLAVTSLRRLAARIDPRRVNGGVFLGLNGTVVKSHGSADATGVAAALALARDLVLAEFPQAVAGRVASVATEGQGDRTEQAVYETTR